MNFQQLVRPNIYNLEPYSSARDEFQGQASVYLDANENPYNNPYNRYPDPTQRQLKNYIAKIKNITCQQIFVGNGSDESIDLTFRIFCEPGKDNVAAIEPTYGMYKVCAGINNVEYRAVDLEDDFRLNAHKLLDATDNNTKVIFLCSPNNPTANLMDKSAVMEILNHFQGIVVIDEAYIDFAQTEGWLPEINKFPNLIVYQTFSKAWGLAAVRCGLALANSEIIALFNKVKYPYNVNLLTQNAVLEQINDKQKNLWVQQILKERQPLIDKLKLLDVTRKVYHSDANFVLVKVVDANRIYQYLTGMGIIVRNRSKVKLCGECLRITVGTGKENRALIDALKTFPCKI
ncbi:MAG: histidinol-phosphate transaminase [Dysgonamonadaceae bacterium]|nr:histidinol-phosphate transaminase [Dysgonamonadaceae bacterium]